jgi:catechol 2,3-dioxygenase-like lactoylglutathione lyase family enzyme
MDDSSVSRPAIGSLHHVSIQVKDLLAAVHFYGDILGLTEVETPPEVLRAGVRWFDLGEGRMLHLLQTEDVVPLPRAHFCITVDNVAGWRAYVESRGIEILAPVVQAYQVERFFMRDPSGNLLEFVMRADRSS